MITDEEKVNLAKLLKCIDTPEIKLSERCSGLVEHFHDKFDKEVDEEEEKIEKDTNAIYDNPYVVDKKLLQENDRKLKELMTKSRRQRKQVAISIMLTGSDPQRPWRTNSSKEKLLRINNDLKQHHQRAFENIVPLNEESMKNLVQECTEEGKGAMPVDDEELKDTVDNAKKTLPNFQYKKIKNSTATAIMPEAHEVKIKSATRSKN